MFLPSQTYSSQTLPFLGSLLEVFEKGLEVCWLNRGGYKSLWHLGVSGLQEVANSQAFRKKRCLPGRRKRFARQALMTDRFSHAFGLHQLPAA